MTTVNAIATRLADALLAPAAGLPPLVVVLGSALGSALVVLAVMKATSNQAALTAVKRRIHAALLEMRLYNDDLRALVRAQGEVLRHNLSYVGLSIVPLLITAVPLTLAIAQLQAWYGYAAFPTGQPLAVTAVVERADAAALPTLEGDGLDVLGPARYFPTLGEVVWRVVPRSAGATTLRLVMPDGSVVEKSLSAADAGSTTTAARRSPLRARAGFTTQVLYPSEPPLDDRGRVAAVRLPYAERTLHVAGQDVHWLWLYLIATFAFVLALRKPLGVVI